MYCMKCGKEIPEKQAFCDSCLEVMEHFPVKPGTRVLLPNRTTPVAIKKSSGKKKVLSVEERLSRARRVIQWLSIALIASLLILFFSVALLFETLHTEDPNRVIGQNYSTIDAAKDSE